VRHGDAYSAVRVMNAFNGKSHLRGSVALKPLGTYIHTYIQTYTHTHIHTDIHTHMHTYIREFVTHSTVKHTLNQRCGQSLCGRG